VLAKMEEEPATEWDIPRRATRSMIPEGKYEYGRCQRRKKEKGLDCGSKDQRRPLGIKCVSIYVVSNATQFERLTRGIDSLMGAII
jgi:hypothetical protein